MENRNSNIFETSNNIEIDDKELAQEYRNRNNYNFLKRLSIERKYQKALEKKIDESYNKIWRK